MSGGFDKQDRYGEDIGDCSYTYHDDFCRAVLANLGRGRGDKVTAKSVANAFREFLTGKLPEHSPKNAVALYNLAKEDANLSAGLPRLVQIEQIFSEEDMSREVRGRPNRLMHKYNQAVFVPDYLKQPMIIDGKGGNSCTSPDGILRDWEKRFVGEWHPSDYDNSDVFFKERHGAEFLSGLDRFFKAVANDTGKPKAVCAQANEALTTFKGFWPFKKGWWEELKPEQ